MKDTTEIRNVLARFKEEGKKVFATSSFQTHSIPLLHLISKVDPTIPIYYLNTGYLFPETLAFKDALAERLGLKIIGLESNTPKMQQRDAHGNLLFVSDPTYCCYINKVLPLEPILLQYDVWINGIRADQNANRARMNVFEKTPQGALRYHPMLNWTSKDIYAYRLKHNLPSHPLEKEGYLSMGCEPCTRKPDADTDGRNARWFGLKTDECGLHTDLITKK